RSAVRTGSGTRNSGVPPLVVWASRGRPKDGPRRSAGVKPMTAWLTAAVVAALASVLTAAQAQEGQGPADTRQFLSPEPLQSRTVQTQSFRRPVEQPREVEQVSPQPAPKQAVPKQAARKRYRAVTTGQATRRTSTVSRPARRTSSVNLRGRAIS